MDFREPQKFENRPEAFRQLQLQGYKLWQWMDSTSAVWWGPGRQRLLGEHQEDGSYRVYPLPSLEWTEVHDRIGTVANVKQMRELLRAQAVGRDTD